MTAQNNDAGAVLIAEDEPPGPSIRFRTAEAVINQASGSTGPGAAEELAAIAREAGLEVNVREVPPSEIAEAVKAAVEAKPDLIIVLAGDGTARLAASLCGPDGPVVSTLPGGTMNMLPKAFYGDRDWPDALRCALADPVVRTVSGGEINGHTFYVAAILGAPALWAQAREAVRERDVLAATRRGWRAARRAFHGRLRFSLEGGPIEQTEALSLLCPLISKEMDEQTALEAAVVDPAGALEAFRLGFNYMFGEWRNDPAITVRRIRRGRAYARKMIPAILDGETVRLRSPAEIRFIPKAFRALEPRRDVGEPRV
jgi:diacylglycerol kinase family enzyme